MKKNKIKDKKIIFSNNQGGKIAALILGIIASPDFCRNKYKNPAALPVPLPPS